VRHLLYSYYHRRHHVLRQTLPQLCLPLVLSLFSFHLHISHYLLLFSFSPSPPPASSTPPQSLPTRYGTLELLPVRLSVPDTLPARLLSSVLHHRFGI